MDDIDRITFDYATHQSQVVIDRSHFSADDLNQATVDLARRLGAEIELALDSQQLSEAGDEAVEFLNDLCQEWGIRGWFYFEDNSLYFEEAHDHFYSAAAADWWCGDCKTVTDFCTQN